MRLISVTIHIYYVDLKNLPIYISKFMTVRNFSGLKNTLVNWSLIKILFLKNDYLPIYYYIQISNNNTIS